MRDGAVNLATVPHAIRSRRLLATLLTLRALPAPAELRTELRAMRRAGFSGAEQILLANIREWGTPTFRERTRSALQEADRLGMRFDITLRLAAGAPIPGQEPRDVTGLLRAGRNTLLGRSGSSPTLKRPCR